MFLRVHSPDLKSDLALIHAVTTALYASAFIIDRKRKLNLTRQQFSTFPVLFGLFLNPNKDLSFMKMITHQNFMGP